MARYRCVEIEQDENGVWEVIQVSGEWYDTIEEAFWWVDEDEAAKLEAWKIAVAVEECG